MTRLTFVFIYTSSRHTVISYTVIIITGILGISLLHVPTWFNYSYHMDHRAYYMYYCSMLSYSCYMIVSCYWYGYSRYWTWELLICDMWNPTTIVPVILFPWYCSRFPLYCSRYIVLCYQQSSGPIIMLPVSCTVVVLVTLFTWYNRS